MLFNCSKIERFRDVFDYIMYDWDYMYNLSKDKEGIFHVNKLSIGQNFVTYKTDSHELAEGLYDRVCQLYDVLLEERREADDDKYEQLVSWIQERLDSNDITGSFGLEEVPNCERERLLKEFLKRGYTAYLYRDGDSIMILEKDNN